MAKKIKKEDHKVKEFFSITFFNMLREFFQDVVISKIDKSVEKARYNLMNSVLFVLSFFFSIIFIFLSLIFLLERYLKIDYGWSFLFIGLLLLILAVLFNLKGGK